MNEKKSLNFFERVFYSIFKFDRYDLFLNEKTGIAIGYILILTLLVTLFCSAIEVYDFTKVFNRGKEYVLENRLPDFVYSSGKLHFYENVENYDDKTQYYFCANTDDLTDEEKDKIRDKTIDYKYALILFNDRVVFSLNGTETQYSFSEYENLIDFDKFDNQELISTLEELSTTKVFAMVFSMFALTMFIYQTLGTLLNVVFLFISALLVCRFINLAISDSSKFNIACYSITLSVILTAIYNVFFYCTNIEIKSINTVYLIIAYIYLIASLFIIKQEDLKQKIEIKKKVKEGKEKPGKTVEELEKEKEEVKKELEQKKEKKEKRDNKRKEGDKDSDLSSKKVPNNGEPDGSEI